MTPPIPEPTSGLNAAVAAELRAEMGRQKLAVQRLSEMADIPYGSLRRYLGAERHIDVSVLYALANALGVDVGDVVSAAAARIQSDGQMVTEIAERFRERDKRWGQVADRTPRAARTGTPDLADGGSTPDYES